MVKPGCKQVRNPFQRAAKEAAKEGRKHEGPPAQKKKPEAGRQQQMVEKRRGAALVDRNCEGRSRAEYNVPRSTGTSTTTARSKAKAEKGEEGASKERGGER
ncbi:hypothetical protein O6H91_13G059300 [Diphasiastrum complanatum]|uniref:Uncharacterized protein n=1 Tax=Diphasiastrum complanatum TaxID=34168 RepID=A0ACC2BV69_DIPCM|nr:hypothetical protein O6H91_13G059300 [Diphasiastrum complanatum]